MTTNEIFSLFSFNSCEPMIATKIPALMGAPWHIPFVPFNRFRNC